jgi:DNA modification methylase/rubredoxin
MPKQKASQPHLIREERAEYTISHEEQTRKESYRERLREFLEDPASRQIEGFPIGEIEDILALSDPPYYTACPNPFLAEIIQQWITEREANRKSSVENRKYHREPFAADVSEGKNDPIYNAHSYHTKVPHKAIMRYILHYTEPGDIVFDGFCGTGMTGVAAQLCGDKKTVESLGYRVTDDGKVYEGDKIISQLGARKAVLNDLSPAATFIAYNYNTPVDIIAFERDAKRILEEVEEECGWMYETEHTDEIKGRINFTIWSDVFICPHCNTEMAFWEVGVDKEKGEVRDNWLCPECQSNLAKTRQKDSDTIRVERAWETVYDKALNQTIRKVKQVPVAINYRVGTKRFEKRPDSNDLSLLQKIDQLNISYDFPTQKMPLGDKTSDPINLSITHAHHFYTKRNIWVLASFWNKLRTEKVSSLCDFVFTSTLPWTTRQNRLLMTNYFHKTGGVVAPNLPGTLYISSVGLETNPLERLRLRIESARYTASGSGFAVSCQSSTNLTNILDDTFDYIFVDPPFGENLMYSELNFLAEAWLKLFTNSNSEAIINKTQKKDLSAYLQLMELGFREFYRVLKPGHWMTVEFHNSKNSVWNSIQQAVLRGGFVIADVSILEKTHKTFNQVGVNNSVKKDLAITAYKPNDNLEERFRLEAGTIDSAWDFVHYHFNQLPRVAEKNGEIEVVAERQAFLLFDRMVAFHIQRGASVPLSAGEFYAGLKQKFVERDGMYFLPDQIAEYDEARLRLGKVAHLTFLVNDEKTAIQWLRQQLDPNLGGESQTFADLQPKFMRKSNQAKHEQMPELGIILEQNFLEDADGHWRVPDPSKATDLERLRLKALLREFETYLKGTGRLRQFRTEAVRAGFAEAYKKREYATILQVAARLPEDVLHEDPDLLMYYDTATLRSEG